MVALEAIRASIVDVDYDIDDLTDCIEANAYAIHDNMEAIEKNHKWISAVDNEIDEQRYRVASLQKDCRRAQHDMEEDRDFLVLYCQ